MENQRIVEEILKDPSVSLRRIVAKLSSKLSWFEKQYPHVDTTSKHDLIFELDDIRDTLDKCAPITLMYSIKEKLKEPALDKYPADCAVVLLPLKKDVPGIQYAHPAIIDLVGWDVTNPREYNYIGCLNGRGTYITSDIDEKGDKI